MKQFLPLLTSGAILLTGLFSTNTADAAYVIEASDEGDALGLGHFTYTGTAGTAQYSNASGGQLPSTTDPTPTFFTLRHTWGGTSLVNDEYTFTYTPGTDGDNTVFAPGTSYNLPQSLSSTGLVGGAAGYYNIYRIAPGNPSVTAGNSAIYNVFLNGLPQLPLTQTVDQNAANLVTGENVGRWELIGNVGLASATDTVIVTMTPTPNPTGYTSMRASGIMFEYVAPIPEPSLATLLGLGALVLIGRRRR